MLDYQNLPTNLDHLTPRELALDICGSMQTRLDVDLVPILSSPLLSDQQKLQSLVATILEARFDLEYQSGNEFFAGDGAENSNELDGIREMLGGGIDTEPNISFKSVNFGIIRDYQGEDLKRFVYNLTKRFENMEQAPTPGQLALQVVTGGLTSVGVAMAVGTFKAMKAGLKFLPALKAGITGIGMKTAITAVVIILAILLLYLFLENPKKILGIVVNKTDKNFRVKNWDNDNKGRLYMDHGHMVDFMEDFAFGDFSKPKVQIQAQVDFGDGDPESFVFAGVYFADRNFGLRGAEGVMIFNADDDSFSFAHMFAVPYFQDNGANIAQVTTMPTDMAAYFTKLHDARKVRVDKTEGSYRMTATVNDPRGGVVACIATIEG